MEHLNMSIVTPTNGRVQLVERLLKSLVPEREDYPYGETEVVIVNSGDPKDAAAIEALCKEYDARFIAGENSVRKKRNLGIKSARYEVILFLDSDVSAEPGLLRAHAEGFLNATEENLGGVFGLTRFVGRKTWWWKIVEQTTYLDSFSFAERWPYQAWTIGNNVSFYHSVLDEVGGFEEDFPFPLGGDDLDMTYRITKSGWLIKSAPAGVTLHSTETWNKPKNIWDRTHRWGSMDYILSKRHPEIFVNCMPKSGILFAWAAILAAVLAIVLRSVTPLWFWLCWFVLHAVFSYGYDMKHHEGGNFFWYACGKVIRTLYRLYYEIAGIKQGDWSCFHKEMSFSMDQTKYMQKRETAMFISFLAAFFAAAVIFALRGKFL